MVLGFCSFSLNFLFGQRPKIAKSQKIKNGRPYGAGLDKRDCRLDGSVVRMSGGCMTWRARWGYCQASAWLALQRKPFDMTETRKGDR